MSNDEWQLLRQFVQSKSQPAFSELVSRYFRLVHGRCIRQLGDIHEADDVTQAVFLVLSKRAGRLTVDVPLGAWLYQVAAFACRNEVKMRARRKRHEAVVALRGEPAATDATETELTALTPLLDTAIDQLGATDRQAVLMRYFENRSVRDVAAALGVTENTAGRRLLRATEKLRRIFTARGVTLRGAAIGSAVSAIVAATSGPTAHAAAFVPAASPGARESARLTLHALRWQLLKPFAALLVAAILIAGVTGWIASKSAVPATIVATAPLISPPAAPLIAAVAPGPSPAPAAPADLPETQVPGVAQLAQWDLLLNENGGDDLIDIGQPVDSKSKLYQAVRCDAGELRQAIAKVVSAGGVAAVSHHAHLVPLPQPVYDGKRYTEQFDPQFEVNEPGRFIWFSGPSMLHNDEFDRLPDGRVRVHLDHPDLNAGIADIAYRNLQRPKGGNGIVFDGAIAPGETIAFIARFVGQTGAVYYHLVAWEAFRATPPEAAVMDFPTDSAWWCQHGPEQLRLWADAARIWSNWTGWGRPAGAPSMEGKLSDGESIWLYALCRPSQYPFCWWDPTGKPAPCWAGSSGVPLDGAPAAGLWAQVGVVMPISRWGRPMPPDDGNGEQESPGSGPIECRQIDTAANTLSIGVPVGSWTEVARLKYGEPITVNGVEYDIVPDAEQRGPWNRLTRIGVLDDQLHVIAVHHDGSRHRFGVQRELKWSKPGIFGKVTDQIWADGDPDTVDYFSIRLRKREFITFTNFATHPVTKPPVNFTRAETNAKLALITRQHLQQCLDQLPAKRLGYVFSWLGPKDDSWNGGMNTLLRAVITHDEPQVRKMLSATTRPASDALNDLAHLMTQGEVIRAAAVARFGEPAAHELLDRPGLFEDLEGELVGVNWAGTLDMVKHVHPYTDMESNDSWMSHIVWTQGPTGEYTLDVDDMFQEPGALDDLKSRCRFADDVRKLLVEKHPPATLDDLRRRIRKGNE